MTESVNKLPHINLQAYKPTDFQTLSAWVTSYDLLVQFAGTEFSYPLNNKEIKLYQLNYPERRFYMGYMDKLPVFFGEIIPTENNIPRLGRLLIGDASQRNRGLGGKFIKLLIQECVTLFNVQHIELYVWEYNAAAIACYGKVGFELLPTEPFVMIHGEKVFGLLKMRYYLSEKVTKHY